jgi:smad nuclear-interacting protein 1
MKYDGSKDRKEFIDKEQPNFEVSGVLAEDQNQRNGVPLLFSVSMDAGRPGADLDWRLYEFAGDETVRTVKLEGYSCFLLGTDERLANDHSSDDVTFVQLSDASCSRQHAVIQFRNRGTVKPYIMDLNSSNRTKLNGASIEPGRYVELRHQDVVQFGRSPNEFVLLDARAT